MTVKMMYVMFSIPYKSNVCLCASVVALKASQDL